MSELFDLTWQQWLLMGLPVLLAYVGAEALFFLRVGRRGETSERQATRMRNLEQRVVHLEEDLARMKHPILPEAPLVAQPEPVVSAYNQAIELAEQGLDANAIAERCGISRGEAELILALQRAR